jgi:hypothetical protein
VSDAVETLVPLTFAVDVLAVVPDVYVLEAFVFVLVVQEDEEKTVSLVKLEEPTFLQTLSLKIQQ